MAGPYGEDLAHIHDAGHAGFALRSAPGILELLQEGGIRDGLVVDLGCGSGRWAGELLRAGYRVLGIDISPAMVELARRRAPGADFLVGSLYEAEIPPCGAVTALGEVLNYLVDPASEEGDLDQLFRRVYGALETGGVFIFDLLGPGQVPGGGVRSFSLGTDWAVLTEKVEDDERGTMERRIVSFRSVGELYRRDAEVHRARLYRPKEIAARLRGAGFEVGTMDSYGRRPLRQNHTAFVARKP